MHVQSPLPTDTSQMADFLTFLLVILTGVYAYLTYLILDANRKAVAAMREQIRASTRPYVHLDLVPDGPLIEVRLRNTGITGAVDVIIGTTPSFPPDPRVT
jgi:hypothetical protein